MTTSAENPRLSDPTDEEKFRNSPLETTLAAKRLYFSDLTENQLMALFCKSPLLRFQICAVDVRCNRSGTRNKLYGFIRVVGGDLTSQYVFNRDFNESTVIHNNIMFLGGICCSVPAHNNVEIHAKLYLTTDKDFQRFSSDYNDEVEDDPEYLECFNDNIQLDDIEDELLKAFNTPDGFDGYPDKEIDIKDDEPFEFCDDSVVINLPDGASLGSNMLEGQGGFVRLYYVAFKYAVDATLEVEFVANNKETKVDGVVMASYGNNFDYTSHDGKIFYKVMLFKTDYRAFRDFLMPGKLNLLESALAVPAQFSLVIDATFMDITSKETILKGSYEFHVPRDGSCSCGSIVGIDCSLNLKVDWKLPPDMHSL